jgi:starch phosphorylase
MLVNVPRLVTADYTEPPDYLSIRGSGSVNDVSRLHGKVSQHLFLPLFPLWQR